MLKDRGEPILQLRGITKSFPGVRALDGVDFDLREGEVHVLLGENGAGKSTLMKVLAGVYLPDSGEILLHGKPVSIRNPRDAERLGISIIHQEFNLLPWRSVAANIFLGREPVKGGVAALVDFEFMRRESEKILHTLGLGIDPDTLVKDLGVAQKQMVEVAKALAIDSRILIMDEPTATLTSREIDHLFRKIRELTSRGVSIVYISHRLDEISRIGHRVTVLRDGKYVGTVPVQEATVDRVVPMMVGRKIEQLYQRTCRKPGEEALSVKGLTRKGRFYDCSLTVRCGEIVGLAGLVGAGRTELARAIFGVDPYDSGEIRVFGSLMTQRSPSHSVQVGMGLLPEDRKGEGLALMLPLKDNVVQASLRRLFPTGLVSPRVESSVAAGYVEELRIATPTVMKIAKFLSGGTQQKVVLAKWLCSHCRVLLFDEPTRGIDVGAKAEIYRLMDEEARKGAAILMISSELPELLGMADRILVMHEGRIVKEFSRDEATQEAIIRYAMGKGDDSSASA